MAELVIRFDLRLGENVRRGGRLLLAGAMMFAAVPELASESVTLTTYYPAPSGVYTTMITTNNTFLARDASANGGQVTVGSSNSGTGQQLDVYSYMGSANNAAIRATYPNGGGLAGTEFSALAHRGGFWSGIYANQGAASYAAYFNGSTLFNNGGIWGNYALTPSYQNWAAYGTGSGGAAIYNDAGSYKTLMLVGNNSAGGSRQVSVWDQLNINGILKINGYAADMPNSGTYVSAAALNTACYFGTYPAGASVTVCAAGYYATQQSGYMSKYVNLNDGQNPAGDVL
ncbi:MAG: hypothetical protein HY079_11415, partial [Elusimicrobia bacterium]|nr:hypothetical protein [Elusimicrobiota bacterium]